MWMNDEKSIKELETVIEEIKVERTTKNSIDEKRQIVNKNDFLGKKAQELWKGKIRENFW